MHDMSWNAAVDLAEQCWEAGCDKLPEIHVDDDGAPVVEEVVDDEPAAFEHQDYDFVEEG